MTPAGLPLVPVTGIFFRATSAERIDQALAGSRRAGRFSRSDQPTLYLSSSLDGVDAAMRAHGGLGQSHVVVTVEVDSTDILDLRDAAAVRAAGLDTADAAALWQDSVSRGETPRSWRFRDAAEFRGARGLIDPSRQEPGLWHLVLFAWDTPGEAQVGRVG